MAMQKTGWLCLDYDEDNKPDDGTVSEIRTSASDTAKWFYFQTNGKAKRSKNDSYSAETIGDNKYYFNEEQSLMMTGWVAVKQRAEAGIQSINKFVLGRNDEASWQNKMAGTLQSSGSSGNRNQESTTDSN